MREDSGFARTNLMNWCEANGVDYIFGLPRNDYLVHKARKIRPRAAVEFLATGKIAKVYGHFYHQTRSGTWNKPPRDLLARTIYEAVYCPRGDMENRIKSLPPRRRGTVSLTCSDTGRQPMRSRPTRPG